MRDYTKINAWKLADDLVVRIYTETRVFPREETYGLTSQLRRAAASVAANIAEGSARNSKKDYLHFLYIARGSLSETQYFIHLAGRLEYLKKETVEEVHQRTKDTFSCLHGLIRSVEQEAGVLRKTVATLTSLISICLLRATT